MLIERHALLPHLYADDTHILGFCSPSRTASLQEAMSVCTDEVSQWMQSNRLQLNTTFSGALPADGSIRYRRHQHGPATFTLWQPDQCGTVRNWCVYLSCSSSHTNPLPLGGWGIILTRLLRMMTQQMWNIRLYCKHRITFHQTVSDINISQNIARYDTEYTYYRHWRTQLILISTHNRRHHYVNALTWLDLRWACRELSVPSLYTFQSFLFARRNANVQFWLEHD